jgi:hypothetical protein
MLFVDKNKANFIHFIIKIVSLIAFLVKTLQFLRAQQHPKSSGHLNQLWSLEREVILKRRRIKVKTRTKTGK